MKHAAAPARELSPALSELVDVIVVNAIEAEQLTDVAVFDSLAIALEAARLLAQTYPAAVVTAGGEGLACATKRGEEFSIEVGDIRARKRSHRQIALDRGSLCHAVAA
ncbi:MAG: hypothetical protein AAAC47_05800 [Pararhizobium sp.]